MSADRSGVVSAISMIEGHHRFMLRNTGNTIGEADEFVVNEQGVLANNRHFTGHSQMQSRELGSGSSEGQASLILGYANAYKATKNDKYLDEAIKYFDAYLDYFYNEQDIPTTAQRWVANHSVNAKQPILASYPLDASNPSHSGFKGVELSFTDGMTLIPHGAPYWGEHLDLATFAFSGTLEWDAIDATVDGTKYDVDWIINWEGKKINSEGVVLSEDHITTEQGTIQLKDTVLTGNYEVNFTVRLPVADGGVLIERNEVQNTSPCLVPLTISQMGNTARGESFFFEACRVLSEITGDSRYQNALNSVEVTLWEYSPEDLPFSPGAFPSSDIYANPNSQFGMWERIPTVEDQCPLVYSVSSETDYVTRLGNAIEFLHQAQQAYFSQFGILGPTYYAYIWDEPGNEEFGTPDTWTMYRKGTEEPDSVYQAQSFLSACKAWNSLTGGLREVPTRLQAFCENWINYLIQFSLENDGKFPTHFPADDVPVAGNSGRMTSLYLSGCSLALLAGCQISGLPRLIESLLKEVQEQYFVDSDFSDMSGSWSVLPEEGEFFGEWSGDVLQGLSHYVLYQNSRPITTGRRASPALRWSRPDTTGWEVIEIGGDNPTETIFVDSGNFLLKQVGPISQMFRIVTLGTANLAWIGGEIRIDEPLTNDEYEPFTTAYWRLREAMHVAGDFRTVYLEGIHMHGKYMCEGLMLMDGSAFDLMMQNCRIVVDTPQLPCQEVWDLYYHMDCIQSWGGLHSYRLSNCTFINPAQGGMFGDGSLPLEGIRWRQMEHHRVNWMTSRKYTPPSSYYRLINMVQIPAIEGPLVLDQVYVDPGPRRIWSWTDRGVFWQGEPSIDPVTGEDRWRVEQPFPSNGILGKDGGPGYFYKGVDEFGEFCPEDVPGLEYVPPPNVVSEPVTSIGADQMRHDSHRFINRTAEDFLGLSSPISRKWFIESNNVDPSLNGTVLSVSQDINWMPPALGDYRIRYELETTGGFAWDDLVLRVVPHRANWLNTDPHFTESIDPWVYYINTEINLEWSPEEGGVMKLTVLEDGSTGVTNGWSNSATNSYVEPGDLVHARVRVKQVAGNLKDVRMIIRCLNAAHVNIAQMDSFPSGNVPMNGEWREVGYTFEIPTESVSATIVPYIQGAEAGDVFLIDDAYFGDPPPPDPNRLPMTERFFDNSLGSWLKFVDPGSFTLEWSPIDNGVMLWTLDGSSSAGAAAIHTWSSAPNRTPVTPGEVITGEIEGALVSGTSGDVYLIFEWGTVDNPWAGQTSQGVDNSVKLTSEYQTISFSAEVPPDVVWAKLVVYSMNNPVAVYKFDNAYLGSEKIDDYIPEPTPNRLPISANFDNSTGQWIQDSGFPLFEYEHSLSFGGTMKIDVIDNGDISLINTWSSGADIVEVEPGETLRVALDIMRASGGDAGMRVSFVWSDENYSVIGETLSDLHISDNTATFETVAKETEVIPGAAFARLRLHIYGTQTGSTYYVDNAFLGDLWGNGE